MRNGGVIIVFQREWRRVFEEFGHKRGAVKDIPAFINGSRHRAKWTWQWIGGRILLWLANISKFSYGGAQTTELAYQYENTWQVVSNKKRWWSTLTLTNKYGGSYIYYLLLNVDKAGQPYIWRAPYIRYMDECIMLNTMYWQKFINRTPATSIFRGTQPFLFIGRMVVISHGGWFKRSKGQFLYSSTRNYQPLGLAAKAPTMYYLENIHSLIT